LALSRASNNFGQRRPESVVSIAKSSRWSMYRVSGQGEFAGGQCTELRFAGYTTRDFIRIDDSPYPMSLAR
jgi:hypothetical protein